MYIKKGMITCIMGKNGMGKTTLLETIIGHHHLLYEGCKRAEHLKKPEDDCPLGWGVKGGENLN